MVLWDGLTEADSATYGVVIHGLCRNGYVNRALQVLEEAEHRGGGVDEFAYLSLINALCKAETCCTKFVGMWLQGYSVWMHQVSFWLDRVLYPIY